MQADQEKKEKQKREQARKNLTAKLRRQAEERRQRQEERIKMMNSIDEEGENNRSRESLVGATEGKSKAHEKLNMAELRE